MGIKYKINDIAKIPIKFIPKNSHIKIDVICDVCGKKRNIYYYNYITQMNRHNFYCCSQKCATIKNKKTETERYGNTNIHNRYKITIKDKLKDIQEKCNTYSYILLKFDGNKIKIKCEKDDIIWKTTYSKFIKKNDICNKCKTQNKINKITQQINKKCITHNLYFIGFENNKYVNADTKLILKCENNHIFKRTYRHFMYSFTNCNQCHLDSIKNEKLTEYQEYRRLVDNLTNRNKKELYENWDGYDYYDNEYIRDNFELNSGDKNYPTIDHKKSVIYGFDNNISPEEISNIENLCITKRTINSSKNYKTEEEFK